MSGLSYLLLGHTAYEALFGTAALLAPQAALDSLGKSFSRLFGAALLGLSALSLATYRVQDQPAALHVAGSSLAVYHALMLGVLGNVARQRVIANKPVAPFVVFSFVHVMFAAKFAGLALENAP